MTDKIPTEEQVKEQIADIFLKHHDDVQAYTMASKTANPKELNVVKLADQILSLIQPLIEQAQQKEREKILEPINAARIVSILESLSVKQGWSEVLHHGLFKNVATKIMLLLSGQALKSSKEK